MEKEELRKAQLCQLKIAEEVKRICDKNEIPYFLAYGTMLGAVRHKGFIPWDDDLDIGILRKDYDRFIKLCETELDDKFFLQTFETDPNYVWPFAKMLLKNTVYRERWDSPKTKNGIYIDIFPLDGAPASVNRQRWNKFRYRIYVRMLQIKIGMTGFLEHGFIKRILWHILFAGSKLFSVKTLQKKLDRVLRDGNKERSGYVYNLNSPYSLKKEVIEISVFRRYVETPFEGVNFKIVKKYDYYLRHYYNDYMKLPPEEDRENRHQIEEFVLPDWLAEQLGI